ncbi:unnamed protein product [Caenorhabditis bovis]|uniref:Uncharacterized protein n=1 Tax=Caenorhabditis bovis TaxID=2654633 RepID=A0A8S1FB30_9PELO|nr:unnamed protein product [Caenorhabditis bovis]
MSEYGSYQSKHGIVEMLVAIVVALQIAAIAYLRFFMIRMFSARLFKTLNHLRIVEDVVNLSRNEPAQTGVMACLKANMTPDEFYTEYKGMMSESRKAILNMFGYDSLTISFIREYFVGLAETRNHRRFSASIRRPL